MKYLTLLAGLFAALGILAQEATTIIIENPNKLGGSYPVSKIGSSFTYIPLETNPDCLIGEIHDLVIMPGYILVEDHKKLLMFDNNGVFVRQIGREGKGPGEYNHISCFALNANNGNIWISDLFGKRILIYDTENNFLRSIPFSRIISHMRFTRDDGVLVLYEDIIHTSVPPDFIMAELFNKDYTAQNFFKRQYGGDFLQLKEVQINKENIFIQFRYLNKEFYGFYKSDSGKIVFPGEQVEPDKLKDDLDQGPTFWLFGSYQGFLFDFVHPVDVEETGKWSEKTGIALSTWDNPIIRILK